MKTRVLYVEDEPSLAKIVSESLISRGYEVIIANNGKEAVDKFLEGNISESHVRAVEHAVCLGQSLDAEGGQKKY